MKKEKIYDKCEMVFLYMAFFADEQKKSFAFGTKAHRNRNNSELPQICITPAEEKSKFWKNLFIGFLIFEQLAIIACSKNAAKKKNFFFQG